MREAADGLAQRAEMEDHFSQKGAIKLVDCRVMGNYAVRSRTNAARR